VSPPDESSPVAALKGAVPYLRRFQGSTFVLKVGGAAFLDAHSTEAIAAQVGVLHRLGIHVALVHGGGPQISAMAEELGLEPTFVEGRRVTCEDTREITTMVLCGTIRTRVLAAFRRLEVPAVGFSGVDGGLIKAVRRPPAETREQGTVDYGYVGDVVDVDPTALRLLLEAGFVPVVSPVSADDDGQVLNVNADTVAARLAVALGARKLVLMTGARGILRDPADESSLVSYTDLAGLDALEAEGILDAGMLPKAAGMRLAIQGGVPRVHVISASLPDSLLIETFTNEGSGTMVVARAEELPAEET